MPAPDGFRVTQQVPGGEPLDLTKIAQSVSWSSSVPGGFGAASLTIPRILTQKERALLGGLTIEHEGRVLFDGRVEDAFFKLAKASKSTDLNAFGYQRLLTDNSIRRLWSLAGTSISPTTMNSSTIQGSSTGGVMTAVANPSVAYGIYNPAVPTKYGIGISATLASQEAAQVAISLPSGLAGVRIVFDYDYGVIANTKLIVHASADGVTYTSLVQQNMAAFSAVSVTGFTVNLPDGTFDIRIALTAVGGAGGGNVGISNIRIFGTPIAEDASGGFYGGTLIRDAISFAPGIYPGTIEDGSDFLISEFARIDRTTILDVVQEIDPLYAREWGVWEAGRFDWVTPDLASGGWLVPLAATTECSIEQSIDAIHKRTYVTYQDAVDGRQKEAFVDSTNARNPYVRTGATKDGIVAAPAAMTSLTAPLLAAKLSNDFGRWPDIKGSVSLLAQTMLAQTGNGSRTIPAFAIRAGDNITIPDLPVEDIYAAGQDGQTVFHVTGVQASTDGTVQLTLEGLTRRADVLLARLGAVSQ